MKNERAALNDQMLMDMPREWCGGGQQRETQVAREESGEAGSRVTGGSLWLEEMRGRDKGVREGAEIWMFSSTQSPGHV